MKKNYYYLLFLFAAQLLDVLFSAIFPMDLTLQSTSISFCFFFLSTLLLARRFDFPAGILICLIAGLFDGVRSYQYFQIGVFVYLFTCTISLVWFKNMNDSLTTLLLILVCSVFLKETVLYVIMHLFFQVSASYFQMLFVRIIPTSLFAIIAGFICLYADDYLEYYLIKRERYIKSNENLFFSNFKARHKN